MAATGNQTQFAPRLSAGVQLGEYVLGPALWPLRIADAYKANGPKGASTVYVIHAPIDAAATIDAAPIVADAREVSHPPPVHNPKPTELDTYLANAQAAQRAGKRMTQVTQAHAAYLLDPHNVKAILLLADGLLAEGDLEHGCKYLRELPRNPVAQQRMRSASCPAD